MNGSRKKTGIDRSGFLGLCIAAGIILAFPGTAPAETAGRAVVEIDLAVPPLQRLEVSRGLLGIPSPTSGHFNRGRLDLPDPVIVEVWSNIPWTLFLRTAEEKGDIPLFYRVDGSRYFPLDGEWCAVAAGERGADRKEIRIEFRILLSWTDMPPGVYEPRVEYRLAPAEEEKR